MVKIGFIGAGTVGTALAATLSERGHPVAAVYSRSLSSAQALARRIDGGSVCDSGQGVADLAELVFITTPDDAITTAVAQVRWRPGVSVVHCNGSSSTDILEQARRQGASVGAFHPLQSFASVDQAIQNIPGSTFALEGEEPLLGVLKELAEALEGRWVVLGPGDKVLYHAAAVIISNYTVALAKMATDLWRVFGVDTPDATRAMLPLLRGTVNNIANVGLPNCLTGPIARGDIGTIEKHLAALESRAPEVLAAYRELGLQAIPVALGKGKIDEGKAKQLEQLLARTS
ncbi:MAG: DUF2520 domain-containing protein [Chloroflexi bacterium]|nr:DUF2520 domain-containing protein [Chloroflexota bacterium]